MPNQTLKNYARTLFEVRARREAQAVYIPTFLMLGEASDFS